jgi:hypothetical protein
MSVPGVPEGAVGGCRAGGSAQYSMIKMMRASGGRTRRWGGRSRGGAARSSAAAVWRSSVQLASLALRHHPLTASPPPPPPNQTGKTSSGETMRVREVWADNLDAEVALIRTIVGDYHFIAMDTEFPGVVARPVGNFKSSREYHYRALKLNVDMLKLIQLGLTFTDAQGNLPVCNGEHTVWQFNFRGFRLADDVYAQDSIELLKQVGGGACCFSLHWREPAAAAFSRGCVCQPASQPASTPAVKTAASAPCILRACSPNAACQHVHRSPASTSTAWTRAASTSTTLGSCS